MKKIDLNIKKDDLIPKEEFEGKTGEEISKQHIKTAIALYQAQPDERGRRGMAMDEQRKVYKILDNLETVKEGILELEDDRYEFLKKIFNEVKWVGGTRIVVRIADRIEEAGIENVKPKS